MTEPKILDREEWARLNELANSIVLEGDADDVDAFIRLLADLNESDATMRALCGEAADYLKQATELMDDEPVSDILPRLRAAAGETT